MDTNGQTAPAPDFVNMTALEPAPAPDPGPLAAPPVDPALAVPQPGVVEPQPAVIPAPVAPEARPTPTVPLPELMEERRARQEAQRQAQYVQAQLHELLLAQQRAQQPQQQPIDPNLDPGAAIHALQRELAMRDQRASEDALNMRANTSEMLARREVGDQVVDQAIESAVKSGLNQHFMKQSDPYRALITWHNSQRIAQEIGNDPNAYKARIEAEVRAKVLAEMRAGTPPPRNLPPSLATATQAAITPQGQQDAGEFFKQMMNRKG